jgi:hypothetical protein
MPFTDVPDFPTEAARRHDSLWDGQAPSSEEIRAAADEAEAIIRAVNSSFEAEVDGVESNYFLQLDHLLRCLGGERRAIRAFRESRWSLVDLPSTDIFNVRSFPRDFLFTWTCFHYSDIPVLRRVLAEKDRPIIAKPTNALDREVLGPFDLLKVMTTAVRNEVLIPLVKKSAEAKSWEIF